MKATKFGFLSMFFCLGLVFGAEAESPRLKAFEGTYKPATSSGLRIVPSETTCSTWEANVANPRIDKMMISRKKGAYSIFLQLSDDSFVAIPAKMSRHATLAGIFKNPYEPFAQFTVGRVGGQHPIEVKILVTVEAFTLDKGVVKCRAAYKGRFVEIKNLTS